MPTTIQSSPEAVRALEDATAEFVRLRPRLHGIAHRILGCDADAEDIVQDAWIRWQTCDRTQVRNSTAFLVTMTTRLALNAAQSARARWEASVGDWFPEPVDHNADPSSEVESYEALERGIHRLLERVSAGERAAFILRQGFDYPYPAIANLLGVSEVNTRQLVSRAGKRLARTASRSVDGGEQQRLIAAVHAAATRGEISELEQVFAA